MTSHLIFMTLTTLTIERCSYSLQHHVTCTECAPLICFVVFLCVAAVMGHPSRCRLCVKKLPCSGMWQTRHPVKPGLWSNILKK